VWPGIDLDGAADDRRIRVVAPLPEVVGDEHDGLGPLAIVRRAEVAPQLRENAEHPEQFVTDAGAGIAIGVAAVADGEIAIHQPGDDAERSRALAPVLELEP